MIPAVQAAPAYFNQNGHPCLIDSKGGLRKFAFGTKQTSFEHLGSNPSLAKDFNEFASSTMGVRKYWVDWYPVESRILNGAKRVTFCFS